MSSVNIVGPMSCDRDNPQGPADMVLRTIAKLVRKDK